MNNAIFAARLWAALEETPMGRKQVTCREGGRTRLHGGYGLCKACYGRQARQAAPGAGAWAHPDPATRLPIPPMVRCGGCADVPACDRAARADVGYCWRCQQARAPGVAA